MTYTAHTYDSVAYIEGADTALFFAPAVGAQSSYGKATATQVKRIMTALEVAPWGEDNRFPQNIEQQLAYCGAAKAGLDWKARALWGNGVIPVKVVGYEPEGLMEKIEPLDRVKYRKVYEFIENRLFYRFYLEFLLDWVWFGNCFPEIILSNDGKTITGLVHQESADCRYKQMNDSGLVDTTYISKLWGMAKDQYAKFDPNKRMLGLMENPVKITDIDNKYVKALRTLDMYNPLEDLKKAVGELRGQKSKSVILPVNYPSPNKTYYQVPSWDGSRLAGWLEIASKIPALLKSLFTNSFNIKYHIEVPDTYMERRLGSATWLGMDKDQRRNERARLVEELKNFLQGADKAGSSLVTFFDIAQHGNTEYGRVKITTIDNKSSVDKELLTSASANSEFFFSAGINPDIVGAGIPGGAYGGNKGGSNIREGKLVYDSLLHLERQVTLEPLYLVRDYNGWGDEVQFRHRDIVLTTLDKGTGSEKKIS